MCDIFTIVHATNCELQIYDFTILVYTTVYILNDATDAFHVCIHTISDMTFNCSVLGAHGNKHYFAMNCIQLN